MNVPDLFLDKLKLTQAVQEKEGQLVGSYASLIRKIQAKMLLKEEANQSTDYENTWRLCLELYLFIRYNKLEELKEQYPDEEKRLSEVMALYLNINKLGQFDIVNLSTAVDLVTFFMSKAGYHSDKSMYSGGSLEDEE